MEKQYRVVIIGFSHMHINDVAAHFYENPRTDLVAGADTIPLVPELKEGTFTRKWNLEFCRTNFKIPKIYEDYREMLDQEKPDLAVITCENAQHLEVMYECAVRGVNVSIEKPMAADLSMAMEMIRISNTYGVKMFVNWPVTWRPELHLMKDLLDEGKIGRILEFKIRVSHTGPLGDGAKHPGVKITAEPMTNEEKARTWWYQSKCGGGAMLDFCCYGAMMSRWLIGKPAVAALGMRANLNTQWGNAEDNASMLVRYDDAMASIETSWTTYHDLVPVNCPMVYGTKGAMTAAQIDGKDCVKVILPDGEEEYYYPPELEYQYRDIACAFVHNMDTNEPVHATLAPEINIDGMAILDAGVRSCNSGRLELVNNWAWKIG